MSVPPSRMRIADFPVPESTAAHGALELATEYQSVSITTHAVRSWLWAEAFAAVEDFTDVDHELLYVAAILHDIGTVTEFVRFARYRANTATARSDVKCNWGSPFVRAC